MTMSRRYTINSSDYPEHLNPFRDDAENDESYNSLARKKTRPVLNITSWSVLQTIKPTTVPNSEASPNSKLQRNKFMTLTPRISRNLMQMLSSKANDNKNKTKASSTTQVKDCEYNVSTSEFNITPKSSREKFAFRSMRERRHKDVDRTVETTPPRALKHGHGYSLPSSPKSEVRRRIEFSESETQCVNQGATPKKKRQAPLPPALASISEPVIAANMDPVLPTPEEEEPSGVAENNKDLQHCQIAETNQLLAVQ